MISTATWAIKTAFPSNARSAPTMSSQLWGVFVYADSKLPNKFVKARWFERIHFHCFIPFSMRWAIKKDQILGLGRVPRFWLMLPRALLETTTTQTFVQRPLWLLIKGFIQNSPSIHASFEV